MIGCGNGMNEAGIPGGNGFKAGFAPGGCICRSDDVEDVCNGIWWLNTDVWLTLGMTVVLLLWFSGNDGCNALGVDGSLWWWFCEVEEEEDGCQEFNKADWDRAVVKGGRWFNASWCSAVEPLAYGEEALCIPMESTNEEVRDKGTLSPSSGWGTVVLLLLLLLLLNCKFWNW